MRGLLLAPYPPWPAAITGATQRTELLRRALSTVAQVDLAVTDVAVHDEIPDLPHVVRVFRASAPARPRARSWLHRLFPLPRLRRRVRQAYAVREDLAAWLRERVRAGDYDFVAVRYLRTAAQAGLQRGDLGVPVLLDCDDLDWPKEAERIAAAGGSLRYRLMLHLANRYRERLCREVAGGAAVLWAVSGAERAALAPLTASVLANVPMSVPAAAGAPAGEAPAVVLFVGLLGYAPNRDGLDWFVSRVWPRVRSLCPDAVLRIAGGGLDEATAGQWMRQAGVRVLGFVPDLAPEYAACRCTVCPVFWGGGSNIKVLESLAHGRPCVASERVSRQFEGVLGAHTGLFPADNPEECAARVAALLRGGSGIDEAARRGREAVVERYSFEAFSRIAVHDALAAVRQAEREA